MPSERATSSRPSCRCRSTRFFAAEQTVFSNISAASFNSRVLTRDGADPEQLTILDVTQSFIPALQLPLARGRNFTADEDKENGPYVCILSYDIWKTRFGKREDIVGSTIQLDGVGTTVVGVLAEGLPAPISAVQALSPWPFSPTFLTPAQREGRRGSTRSSRCDQASSTSPLSASPGKCTTAPVLPRVRRLV
jgi:hypothetical protein